MQNISATKAKICTVLIPVESQEDGEYCITMDRRQRWLLCKAALLSFFASFSLIKSSRYIRKVFFCSENCKNQMSAWKFSGRREKRRGAPKRAQFPSPPQKDQLVEPGTGIFFLMLWYLLLVCVGLYLSIGIVLCYW